MTGEHGGPGEMVGMKRISMQTQYPSTGSQKSNRVKR